MLFPSEYPTFYNVIQSEAKDLGNIRQKTSSYRNFSTEAHCNYLMLSDSELPEEDFQLFILNICGFVCFL